MKPNTCFIVSLQVSGVKGHRQLLHSAEYTFRCCVHIVLNVKMKWWWRSKVCSLQERNTVFTMEYMMNDIEVSVPLSSHTHVARTLATVNNISCSTFVSLQNKYNPACSWMVDKIQLNSYKTLSLSKVHSSQHTRINLYF